MIKKYFHVTCPSGKPLDLGSISPEGDFWITAIPAPDGINTIPGFHDTEGHSVIEAKKNLLTWCQNSGCFGPEGCFLKRSKES